MAGRLTDLDCRRANRLRKIAWKWRFSALLAGSKPSFRGSFGVHAGNPLCFPANFRLRNRLRAWLRRGAQQLRQPHQVVRGGVESEHPADAGGAAVLPQLVGTRAEEHTSELQAPLHLVCPPELDKNKK